MSNNSKIRTFKGNEYDVKRVTFASPSRFLSVSYDKTLKVWDINQDGPIATYGLAGYGWDIIHIPNVGFMVGGEIWDNGYDGYTPFISLWNN